MHEMLAKLKPGKMFLQRHIFRVHNNVCGVKKTIQLWSLVNQNYGTRFS